VDGHDIEALEMALNIDAQGKLLTIIANTIKGKDVCSIGSKLECYYKSPNNKQYEKVLEKLKCQ
jgi:transketolase